MLAMVCESAGAVSGPVAMIATHSAECRKFPRAGFQCWHGLPALCHGFGKALAVNRQCGAVNLVVVSAFHNQAVGVAQFRVTARQHLSRHHQTGKSLSKPFGQRLRDMRVRLAHGPHFVQHHGHARIGGLPCGLSRPARRRQCGVVSVMVQTYTVRRHEKNLFRRLSVAGWCVFWVWVTFSLLLSLALSVSPFF